MLLRSLCLILLLTAASITAHALEIKSVVTEKAVVNADMQEIFSLRFILDEPATVTLNIYDEREYLVRTINLGELQLGGNSAQWDLKDIKGDIVPSDIYHYTLSAKNDKSQALFDLTDITGKETLMDVTVHWDAQNKKISYALPKAAVIGIRAGLDDRGPLLNTLVNWQPRQAGVHEESWNGMDASGVLDLSEHPHLLLVADVYSLPDNTIFVLSGNNKIFTSSVIKDSNGDPVKRMSTVIEQKKMVSHAQQAVELRGDYPISLTIVGSNKKQKDGATVVQGEVAFVLDVDPSLVGRLLNQRFEQSFYVDGRYHFENEIGFLPATLKWNSAEYSEGVHYLTANLRGYEGNFGMATVKVYVKR